MVTLDILESLKCVDNAKVRKVEYRTELANWKRQNRWKKFAGLLDEDGREEDGEDAEEEVLPAMISKMSSTNKGVVLPLKRPKMLTIDVGADLLEEAKNVGYDRQLKTLLGKSDIQRQKISGRVVLQALRDTGGKTVAAKKALLLCCKEGEA